MQPSILRYPDCEDAFRRFNARQYRMLAQHSWAWQSVIAECGDWTWNALSLMDESDVVACIPFCERETDIGRVAMSSPLAASYGGVLHVEECDRAAVYRRLLRELHTYCRDSNIDIVTIFSSPFRDDLELYRRHLQPTYTVDKFYQYIPGGYSPDTLSNSKFRNNLARNLRHAQDNGLEFRKTSCAESDLIEEWYVDILRPRLNDIDATPPPKHFLKAIAEKLGPEELCEFAFVEHDGRMVAGGLFLSGWCQDIYLRAAKSEYLKAGASMFLDYQMLRSGFETDTNAHNFQSSPSRESQSYAYKRSWGCVEDSTCYFVKVLTDETKFFEAGIKSVTKAFPYFFVLPYSEYMEVV